MLAPALSLLASLTFAQDAGAPAPAPEPAPEPTPAPAPEPTPAPEPAPAPAAEPAAAEPAAPAKQWRWAALPIGNYSSTYGVGYGAYGNIVNNGTGDLGDDPYRAKFALQIYHTTGSFYDDFFKMDLPGLAGSPFRWDLQAGVTGWPTASWYGWGNNTLREPESEQLADGACHKETYEAGASTDDPGLIPCYYNYGQKASFKLITNLRREITGPWSMFVNAYTRTYTLNIYPGSLVDNTQPVGVDGGVYGRLGLGMMYDTRNAEPTPTGGMFTEVSVRGGMNFAHTDERVLAVNITDRRWLGLGANKRVVLASREILDVKFGNEPFFMSQTIGGSEDLSIGTSGLMRGLPYGRLAGDGAIFWQPELRWKYHTWHIGKSSALEFMTGPYFDVGRVWLWDAASRGATDDEIAHFHYGYGLGNRFIFNEDLVVRLDFGFGHEEYTTGSKEDFGLFLVFDHPY